MNLTNEQSMRYAHSVPTRRDWVTAYADHNESSSEEHDADDLLQRLVRLPRQQRHRQQTADNCCEVCLIGQRDGVTLTCPVRCGHARFCATCVDRVVSMGTGCPICHADIQMVMRVYNWKCSCYNEFSCFKMTSTCFCGLVCYFFYFVLTFYLGIIGEKPNYIVYHFHWRLLTNK